MALTNSETTAVTPNLLGIPLELRKMIYDYLVAEDSDDLLLYMYLYTGKVFRAGLNEEARGWTRRGIPAVLCTCRQIRDEASEHRYSKREVAVCVMPWGGRERSYDPDAAYVGKAEEISFWRFIKKLTLRIPIAWVGERKDMGWERLGGFFERALENGKYLKVLDVNLSVPKFPKVERTLLPEWFAEVVEALKQMRVQGDVVVEVDNNLVHSKDELCLELEDIIRGAKDAHE